LVVSSTCGRSSGWMRELELIHCKCMYEYCHHKLDNRI
jgi:hypothetical protein